MAGSDRAAQTPVAFLQQLQDNLYRYGFFQAIRQIECAYGVRIGATLHPDDDPVRLGQEPFLGFSPSALASFRRGETGRPNRLSVYFMGLFGPNGPLPHHLTDHARDRKYNCKDPVFVRFADIFHHRILTLFYRAWANAQPTVSLDRPESDRFSLYVGSLIGMGMPSFRDRDALPDYAKFHFAGFLSAQNRHAEGLVSMIEKFFQVPIAIEEFVGQWIDFEEPALFRLGASEETASLGRTSMLGTRVWDCRHKFRLVLGPLERAQFERFLPGGPSLDRLVALVRNYIGDELDWDLRLIIRREALFPVKLGGQSRLGMTSWTEMDAKNPKEADALLLDPMAWQSSR
ncbi:MAG: type VI secretion system baseplate subunit TssG [Planctomycetota bacterium]